MTQSNYFLFDVSCTMQECYHTVECQIMCFKTLIFICFLAYIEAKKYDISHRIYDVNPEDPENTKILRRSYKMNFTSDSVKLHCAAISNNETKGTADVQLTRIIKEDVKGQDADNQQLPYNNSVSNSHGEEMNDKLNSYSPNKNSGKYDIIIIWTIMGCGTVTVIILIIIIIKVCRSSKKDTAKSPDDVTYENLCNESGSPTPFPRSARLEETYIRPVDCQESPYAIPTTDQDPYALPYIEKNIENLYSKPVPKAQRGKDAEFKSLYTAVLPKSLRPVKAKGKEPMYAEIDTDNKSSKGKFNNKTPEYAKIMNKNVENLGTNTKRRPEINHSYTNVFPINASYVNSKDNQIENDEYAEPSYCEINKL